MHSEIIKHAQSLIVYLAERINPFPTDGLYVYDKLEFARSKYDRTFEDS